MSIENPWLAGGRSAAAAALWGMALLVFWVGFGLTLEGHDSTEALFAGGFLSFVFLFAAGIIALVTLGQRRSLDAMLAEPPVAHWIYDDEQWRRFLERSRRRTSRFVVRTFLIAGFIGFGVGASLAFGEEGKRIGNSTLLTLLVPGFVCLAIGGLVSLTIVEIVGGAFRRKAAGRGEAWIGTRGLYLPGEFWGWNSGSTNLAEVSSRQNGEELFLVFVFQSPNRSGFNVHEVLAPVPPGEEQSARRLVEQLTAPRNTAE